ncbi:hypothetical protein Fcan01_17932 [Folsomia candida]|uniref:Uncharacterized protein n=1 Tax=Folsomia candida TaxID=158441 RepID=A0A226DTT8_FOLCA|nr:hypothetical protein Fcan01_17932 [Folsomia candida]
MPNLQALYIYRKVFLFYFEFPCAYNRSTRRFYVKTKKDLFYSFYVPELIVIIAIFSNLAELINILYSEKIQILQVVVLLIGLIQCSSNVTTAAAISLVKYEYAAFLNDLIRQVERLERGSKKRLEKWDKLAIMLSNFIVVSTLPILFTLFEAYLTINDKLAHLQYDLANSVCPMNTYFACKLITFIVLEIYYVFVAFHCTAILVGSVVTSAVILNMLMDSVICCSRLDLDLRSCAISQLLECLVLFGCRSIFFPTASVIGMVAIGVLLPYGIACQERTGKLLTGWKGKLKIKRGTMRLEEKMVKALRPIGIRAGTGEFSFFVLKKSTKTKYYVAVTDKTIEALMT